MQSLDGPTYAGCGCSLHVGHTCGKENALIDETKLRQAAQALIDWVNKLQAVDSRLLDHTNALETALCERSNTGPQPETAAARNQLLDRIKESSGFMDTTFHSFSKQWPGHPSIDVMAMALRALADKLADTPPSPPAVVDYTERAREWARLGKSERYLSDIHDANRLSHGMAMKRSE